MAQHQPLGPRPVPTTMSQDFSHQQARQPPSVEISDIRREKWTEADYRVELTRYFTFRFEPSKGSWKTCVRTRVVGMLKKAVANEVQELNKVKSLTDRKRSLSPAQQRQLEKAFDELSRENNDNRFEYTLVQIDVQRKRIKILKRRGKKDWSTGGKKLKKRKRKGKGRKKNGQGTKKDRIISITAYYKYAPLATVNAQQLARDLQAEQAAKHAIRQGVAPRHQPKPDEQHAYQQQHLPPRPIPLHNQNAQYPPKRDNRPNKRQEYQRDRRVSLDDSSSEEKSKSPTRRREWKRSRRSSINNRKTQDSKKESNKKIHAIRDTPTLISSSGISLAEFWHILRTAYKKGRDHQRR